MERGSRKCIGILQPVYLPWLGYFDQINYVDHFVFQDDVQYTRQDWRNRNRIKTSSGPFWLTIPIIRSQLDTLINEMKINHNPPWRRKHLQSIRHSYSKAVHISPILNLLSEEYSQTPEFLADQTISIIEKLSETLGIDTPMSRSRDVPKAKGASLTGRILEIAQAHNATDIYLGAKAEDYVDTIFLKQFNINVEFQNFQHPEYDQLHGAFISHMSIIDYMMNVGVETASNYFKNLPKFESI